MLNPLVKFILYIISFVGAIVSVVKNIKRHRFLSTEKKLNRNAHSRLTIISPIIWLVALLILGLDFLL